MYDRLFGKWKRDGYEYFNLRMPLTLKKVLENESEKWDEPMTRLILYAIINFFWVEVGRETRKRNKETQ